MMLFIILLLLLYTILTPISSDSVDDIDVMISIAYKEARAGNIKAAASTFHKAADISSNRGNVSTSIQLYFNTGMAYSQINDYPNAIKSYKRCLELSKNSFRPCHIKVASVYRLSLIHI